MRGGFPTLTLSPSFFWVLQKPVSLSEGARWPAEKLDALMLSLLTQNELSYNGLLPEPSFLFFDNGCWSDFSDKTAFLPKSLPRTLIIQDTLQKRRKREKVLFVLSSLCKMPETLSCLLEFKNWYSCSKNLINMETVLILLKLIFPEFHFAATPPHHFFLKCDTFRNTEIT